MGTQTFTLYNENTGWTIQAKVTWGESYDPSTNRTTVTIQALELLQNHWSEMDANVTGVVKINGSDVASIPMQTVFTVKQGEWKAVPLTSLASPVIQHDASGAANMTLAIEKNGQYLGFLVYMRSYTFYGGQIGNPSSYTVALTQHDRGGKAYIDNGSSLAEHEIYIDNGTSFNRYKACIDTGTAWSEY